MKLNKSIKIPNIIVPNLFIWNGMYLGQITDKNILYDVIDPNTGLKYWLLKICGFTELCIYRVVNDPSVCIFDEMMSLFNIPKMGTHHLKYKNKIYLIQKGRFYKNTIQSELILSKITLSNEYIIDKIRNLYVVRDILGIPHTVDGDIIYRSSTNKMIPDYVIGYKIYPVNNRIYDKNESTIYDTTFKQWFMNKDTKEEIYIRDIYKKLFPDIKNDSDISIYISGLKTKMDKIIEKIDNRFNYLSNMINERLTNRLILMIDS